MAKVQSSRLGLLWAKAPERLVIGQEPYPLTAHLLDTAAAAGALWDAWLCERLRGLLTRELAPGSEERARRWVQLAAALHDLGKASSEFQTQSMARGEKSGWREQQARRLADAGLPVCSDLVRQSMSTDSGHAARRHELVGLEALLPGAFANSRRVSVGQAWLPLVVAGHHGHWQLPGIGDVSPSLLAELTGGAWGDAQRDVVEVVAATLGVSPHDAPEIDARQAGVVVTLVTGLVILADWIASSDAVVGQGFRAIDEGRSPEAREEWLHDVEQRLPGVVRDCLGSFAPPSDAMAAVLGRDASGRQRTPRPLQEDAVAVGAGAWFVTYPTGEGKTEAAMLRHLAQPKEGLIFGLPTRATTDAMQPRLERMLGACGNPVVLSHQFAAVHRIECSGTDGLDWFSSPVRRLMAPVVAATCDQVLTGALRRKHAALRLLALANHHVVLDEVHTFDAYQSGLLEELMAWWGATGTRVTILSATLPARQQEKLARSYLRASVTELVPAYPSHRLANATLEPPLAPPLSTSVPDLPVRLVHADDADDAHVRWTLETHARHPSCHLAVVRSTVDDAIATARALTARLCDAEIDVVCLHSRMTVAHRRAVESSLVERLGPRAVLRRPVAVVATQVVEASLDLDFDMMSTDLVPAPALVQRAGRLWRFRDPQARIARFGSTMPEQRELHVVIRTEDGSITGGSSLPYFAAELRRVESWLKKHPVIAIPDLVQEFVDTTVLDLESAEVEEAGDEIGLASRQHAALLQAAAPIRGGLVEPKKRTRYSDLACLTGDGASAFNPADGMAMGTRFSERDSVQLLLLDGPFGCGLGREQLAATTHRDDLVRALDSAVTVSGRVLRALLTCSGGAEWSPKSLLLKNFGPIDSGQIATAGLMYEDQVGLCWVEEGGYP